MPLQEYEQIRLRDEFQDTLGDRDAIDKHPNRTPGKDDVAQYIRDEVIADGRWPIQMTKLAEETGYSRQHAANVISDYFRGVDEDDITQQSDPTQASPMSASPDLGSTTDSQSTGSVESKTVYVKTNDHVEELKINIPGDVDQSSYVRGYLDAVEQR